MVRTRPSGSNRKPPAARASLEVRRVDRLADIVDQCTAAKRIADSLGERFLAYLLAMAIQETRTSMRMEIRTRARPPAADVRGDAPD